MRPAHLVTAIVVLACCAPAGSDSTPDANVPYTGPTSNGAIPSSSSVPEDPQWTDGSDAGDAVPVAVCCTVDFQISASGVPPSAVGIVIGTGELTPGVVLAPSDAGFSGSACLSFGSSVAFDYEFGWGESDGGVGHLALTSPAQRLDDAGVMNVISIGADCSSVH